LGESWGWSLRLLKREWWLSVEMLRGFRRWVGLRGLGASASLAMAAKGGECERLEGLC
jgi:hypothetical protein